MSWVKARKEEDNFYLVWESFLNIIVHIFVPINKNTRSYMRRASFYEKVFYSPFNFEVNFESETFCRKTKLNYSVL